jgi:hypothetical protein
MIKYFFLEAIYSHRVRGTTKIDAWHYQTICVALPNYLRGITKPMRGNTNARL